jgi:hypothetical protein
MNTDTEQNPLTRIFANSNCFQLVLIRVIRVKVFAYISVHPWLKYD